MTVNPDLSLADLQNLGSISPYLSSFANRLLVETYEDFVDLLYIDIDDIISDLQTRAELLQNDRSEDRLTTEILGQLKRLGYDATHDTKHRGHCDFVVKGQGNGNRFVWLGEAKVHRGYDYLLKGFLQLSSRYSTGSANQREGGVVIYIYGQNAQSVMNEWKERLKLEKLPDYKCSDCNRNPISFFSEHQHNVSGMSFRVRHMPVMLYFKPKDRA